MTERMTVRSADGTPLAVWIDGEGPRVEHTWVYQQGQFDGGFDSFGIGTD